MGVPYDIREAQTAASKAKLSEVVEAGVKRGYWTQVCVRDSHSTHVTVANPQGLHFDLSAGGWRNENTITASVARRETPTGDLRVFSSDVRVYGTSDPTASATATRDAATIAKTLNKRLVALPEAIALAQKVADTLASRVADRDALSAHIATLEQMGYGFNQPRQQLTYKAVGYRRPGARGPSKVEVTSRGELSFSIDTTLDKFAAIVAAMEDSE